MNTIALALVLSIIQPNDQWQPLARDPQGGIWYVTRLSVQIPHRPQAWFQVIEPNGHRIVGLWQANCITQTLTRSQAVSYPGAQELDTYTGVREPGTVGNGLFAYLCNANEEVYPIFGIAQ